MEGDSSDKVCYAPVILCYSGDDLSSYNKQLFANPIVDGNEGVKQSLLNASNNLHERDMSFDDKKRIGDYYNQMLFELSDGSTRSQRIVALMKSFFDKNPVKTFVK